MYERNCPKCGDKISYKNPRSFKWAERDKKTCRKCYSVEISKTIKKLYDDNKFPFVARNKEFEKNLERRYVRNCPNCGEEQRYARKYSMESAEKNKKTCNKCSAYKYKKTFKGRITEDHIRQMRATKAGYATFEDYEREYPKKQLYKREVWRLTYKQPIHTLPNWELRGRCGVKGAYQLDHIQSIDWGYKNSVSPSAIAEFGNLRMIPWKENLLKSSH